ncbi:xaa-Pro aminopeptidase 2 precursor [Camelus ferus]|nr:xaa-Pro aminopeptidase 2 precursor [Camelus ferus]
MHTQNLSAYIIPDTDAHMSEYISKYDQRRAWMTGFTGSAGIAVVTMGKAVLWTDSRYWTQAERQMDCNWELHKEGKRWLGFVPQALELDWVQEGRVGTTPIVTWLLAEIPVGGHVGFDPFLFSIDSWESYDAALRESDRELVSITINLVDLVWGSERPAVPSEPIYALQEAFTALPLKPPWKAHGKHMAMILTPRCSAELDMLIVLLHRDGTTDITRTVHWGTPSAFQKEVYTRVLIGNIDLSRLVFPAATSGRMVEAFARRALWDVGLNYGHGTGHGIGNFLCVHEWPVGFQSNNIAMAKGMFTSIEPGYYQDGEFGIRIEDVVLVVEAQTKYPGTYLTFEVVSLVPYDRNLIDVSLLSPEQAHTGASLPSSPDPRASRTLRSDQPVEPQLQYLNRYYQTIREKVGPELQRRQLSEELSWLQRHTEPLSARAAPAASWAPLMTVSTLAILGWSV